MQVNFGSQLKYEKRYKTMPIVPSFVERKNRIGYSVLGEKDTCVGSFTIQNQGNNTIYLDNFVIPSGLRGKKVAADVIYSIRDFLKKKVEEQKIDCIQFDAKKNNPNNVVRLYKKLCPDAISHTYSFGDIDYVIFSIPTSAEERKHLEKYFSPEHFYPDGNIKVDVPDEKLLVGIVEKL